MSFVLEALKKQEADADPDAAVSLARAAAQTRRHRLWMGLFAAAMAVNVAVLVWVLIPPGAPAPVGSPVGEPGEPVAELAAAAPGLERPAATKPPSPEPAAPAPAAGPATADPAPSAPAPARPLRRVSLGALPEPVRRRFPGIAFSTHIYSEDPELRAIVANGNRLQEGDRVRGLLIEEITESGVVLAFEDYLVEVPLALEWEAL